MTAASNGRRLRYMEIAEDIRKRIRDGQVDKDGRVGTYGTLEDDYGAAKGTIDKALSVLRQEGTVVTIAGKGIYATGAQALEEDADLRERVTTLEAEVAELREGQAVLREQLVGHITKHPQSIAQNTASRGRRKEAG